MDSPTRTMAECLHQIVSQRGQYVGLREAWLSISQTARQMGVSRLTVRLWLERYDASGNLLDLPGPGRTRGLHHRVPAVKERLEDRHREGRLRFAQQYVDENIDFRGRVSFTDEKTFSSTNFGRLHCWRMKNSRYDPQNVFQEARSGHVTANIWGWVSVNSVGEMTDIEGRFTAEKYLEILEVILPTLRTYTHPYPEKIVFMQVCNLLCL